jgi:hypothetical protein
LILFIKPVIQNPTFSIEILIGKITELFPQVKTASDQSSYMTGQAINVTGGQQMD